MPLSRVGRIAVADGAVGVRPAGGEWGDSGVNTPIAAGMAVRTTGAGRTLLRIGAEALALAPGSEIALAELDGGGTQIVLRQGRIGIHLSKLDPARSIEIDLASGGIWLLTPGDYDIGAGGEHASARLAVLDGRARFVGKGLETAVATGSAALLGGSDPVTATADGAKLDDFVEWWRQVAGDDADSPALRYVSAEMTGYEALDGAGEWRSLAGYSAVWFPNEAPDGWAPYRNGHWQWLAPWGWTWIDDAKWAFAPSHYGRWARLADPETGIESWGWVPGILDREPVYAPAAVAFLGTAGIGLSYPDSFAPAVAWFPLAPGEVYWPSYSSDPGVIRGLNPGVAGISSLAASGAETLPAALVEAEYQNRRFASVVPRPVFLAGKPVVPALVSLPERRLDNAPLLVGSPQLAPTPPRALAAATSPASRFGRAVATLARILGPHGKATLHSAVLARAHVPHGHPHFVLAVAHSRAVAGGAHATHPKLRLAAVARHR